MSGRGAQKLKRICALTGAWLSRLLRPTAREGMNCPRSLFPPFPLFPKDLNRHTNQGSEEKDPETNFVGVANCGLTNVNRYRQTKQNQKKVSCLNGERGFGRASKKSECRISFAVSTFSSPPLVSFLRSRLPCFVWEQNSSYFSR